MILYISFTENWSIAIGAVALIAQSALAYEYSSRSSEIFVSNIKIPPEVQPEKNWLQRHFNSKTKKVIAIAEFLAKGVILVLKGVNDYSMM